MRKERTYTLAEARLKLARVECGRFGHDWSIISNFGGWPTGLTCGRCGESCSVESKRTTPYDPVDLMCPNCVTPWKCNGPHDEDNLS